MYSTNLQKLIAITTIQILIAVIILASARALSLYYIADSLQFTQYSPDISKAFILGARYDLKVIAIALALPSLIGLVIAYKASCFDVFLKLQAYSFTLISFLLVFLSVVNFYYFKTYNNFIDLFIFGLVDDDTIAILKTTWSDYPVILIFLFSFLIAWIFYKANLFIIKKYEAVHFPTTNYYWTGSLVFIFIFCLFFFARGTLGTLPLKRYQANVSDYQALNQVTPNAFMLLHWALTDYKENTHFLPVNKSEFASKVKQVTTDNSIFKNTPENLYLETHQPNIVIAVMESMGTRVLDEDIPNRNDLLGNLRPHFKNDFLFKRFYAETSATIDTLMEILVHSNVPTISHSSAVKIKIVNNAMAPYKKAGYETIFLYGGNAMWRNLATYLPQQDFDHVFDENNITTLFPEAKNTKGEWGVADEYTLQYANYLLEKAIKPTIITIMTVTNHSPHHAPSSYTAKPISISNSMKNSNSLKGEKLHNMLEAYQYASNSLGNFITRVKHSKDKNKTIIIATGDHRARSMTANNNLQLAAKSQVPFYLYIPDAILKQVPHYYDPKRVGSHKDLFPTLYNVSLSNARYISLGGENMLSPQQKIHYWGWSAEAIYNDKGSILPKHPELIFNWKQKTNLFSSDANKINKQPFSHADYYRLKSLFINKEIAGYQ